MNGGEQIKEGKFDNIKSCDIAILPGNQIIFSACTTWHGLEIKYLIHYLTIRKHSHKQQLYIERSTINLQVRKLSSQTSCVGNILGLTHVYRVLFESFRISQGR